MKTGPASPDADLPHPSGGGYGNRAWVLLVIAVFFGVYVPNLWSRGPWFTDEIRYVEVAREMGEYGDFLVPHLNGEVYAQKPPLFFWAVAAVQRVVGSYPMAGEVVGLLSVAGSLALILALGHLLFGDARPGLLAALLYATLPSIGERAWRPLIDSFLLPWVLLGSLGLLLAAAAAEARTRRAGTLLAVLGCTAACMTKGPVGPALAVVGAWVVGLVWRGRGGVRLAPGLLALAVGLASTALWAWLATRRAGPSFWNEIVFGQALGRVADTVSHSEPWHFHITGSLTLLLPWLVLLPGALAAAFGKNPGPGATARAARGLTLWFLTGILFFSALEGKRGGYIQPLCPFIVLVLAHGLWRHESGSGPRGMLGHYWTMRLLYWLLVATTGFLLLGFLGWLVLYAGTSMGMLEADLLPQELPGSTGVLLLLGGGVLLPVTRAVRRRSSRDALAPVFGLCLAMALVYAIAHGTLMPMMDATRSSEKAGYGVAQALPEGSSLVLLGSDLDGRVNLATGVRQYKVIDVEEVQGLMGGEEPLWIATRLQIWLTVPERLRAGFETVFTSEASRSNPVILVKALPGLPTP